VGLQNGSDGDCIRVKVLVSWGSEWLFLGNEFVDGGKRDKDGSRVAHGRRDTYHCVVLRRQSQALGSGRKGLCSRQGETENI
jgi:hypothetical protein